jgi:hypothetical protein
MGAAIRNCNNIRDERLNLGNACHRVVSDLLFFQVSQPKN